MSSTLSTLAVTEKLLDLPLEKRKYINRYRKPMNPEEGSVFVNREGTALKVSGAQEVLREMGHSTVQVTETYLKEFRSTEARREHTDYSLIGQLNLHLKKKRRKSQEVSPLRNVCR